MKLFKYKYTGTGIIAFWVDKKRYEVGVHPKLSTEVDLPKKVNIPGLKLIEDTKRKSK